MVDSEGELAWGWIRPGRCAVAIGDRAIGFIDGDEEVGFTAHHTDGTPVPGTHQHLSGALEALLRAARQQGP